MITVTRSAVRRDGRTIRHTHELVSPLDKSLAGIRNPVVKLKLDHIVKIRGCLRIRHTRHDRVSHFASFRKMSARVISLWNRARATA